MKKLLLLALLFISIGSFAQNETLKAVSFKTVKHDFGKKLEQGKPVSVSFTFKNTSSKALVIENAQAGCGCTTPEYPKQPIAKGKSATIKVTYNAATAGPFTKDVTVTFAGYKQPIILNISGEVIAKK